MILMPGCTGRTIDLRPSDGATVRDAPIVLDWSDWGLTLSRAAAGDMVDYDRLLKGHRCLDRFLSRISRLGPQTAPRQFVDRDSRVAYLINAYNATILRSVLELARDGKLPRRAPGDLESRYRFWIDGRLRSPADLRRAVEELAADDWRVRLALCDGRGVGPPLPRQVLLGDMLDAQLNHVTCSGLLSPRVVSIDYGERKRLLVWSGLYKIKDRLIRDYENRLNTRNASFLNVLLERSDEPRREVLNSAVGYEVAMMPSSDHLNALDPAREEERGISSVFESIRSFSFLRPE
ncbi:MAG: DUF547 domain-containing protein [Phycisphaerae bacterium]|nr:DUF547 domain-containing protein [Phycisphaerae bacterium]